MNQNYGASGLDTGDLDHDGDVDVVVTTDAGVDIFSNDGDGNFTLDRHLLTDDTLIAATGDIDNDGLTNLLAVPWDEVRTWRQTDTGGLSADPDPLFSDFPQLYTLLVVDLNGDGLNDVIAQNGVWVKARLQRTRGGFGEVRTLFSGWDEAGEWVGLNKLAVGDVNADGAVDLVITRGGNHDQGIVVLPAAGGRLLRRPRCLSVVRHPRSSPGGGHDRRWLSRRRGAARRMEPDGRVHTAA